MEKLDEYLTQNCISSADFAGKIGADHSTVWRLRNGKMRPGADLIIAIRNATDGAVTLDDWAKDVTA